MSQSDYWQNSKTKIPTTKSLRVKSQLSSWKSKKWDFTNQDGRTVSQEAYPTWLIYWTRRTLLLREFVFTYFRINYSKRLRISLLVNLPPRIHRVSWRLKGKSTLGCSRLNVCKRVFSSRVWNRSSAWLNCARRCCLFKRRGTTWMISIRKKLRNSQWITFCRVLLTSVLSSLTTICNSCLKRISSPCLNAANSLMSSLLMKT